MQNNKESHRSRRQGASEPQDTSARSDQSGRLSRWMQSLLQMGLGEPLLRAATHIFSVIAIVIVIWLAQVYFSQPNARTKGNQRPPQGPTPPPAAPLTDASAPQDLSSFGIVRQTDPHTNIPARPRQDIVKYTVVAGDTVSGIAERYGLQPATIFAANYYILLDDPHSLRPGQVLNILPIDGVYREWQAGEGINLVARFYHVKPDDIVNFSANHLSPATVGDYDHPNIAPGTWIIVPGGVYQYHAPGSVPLGITRSNPASAQVAGAGACAPVTGGAVGYGTFVYPTDRHFVSGFDYSTKTNHLGIDLAGNMGDNVYAADGGVRS